MIFDFFKTRKIEDFPECWSEYLSYFKEKMIIDKPFSETEFVVIDIESNGFDAKKDRILSIGAVKIINNQIDISVSF